MTKIYAHLLMLLAITGCQQYALPYEKNSSGHYDRQKLCEQINDLLKDYDGSKDYQDPRFTSYQVKRIYQDSQIYGCDK